MDTNKTMPVIFCGHGSPMYAIGKNRVRDTWRKMGETLGKPRVIIAISAHWITRGLLVRSSDTNPQINDMFGFPEELSRVHYEPAGSKEYAAEVLKLLGDDARINNDWGIDHGIWTSLSNFYPDADVPVVMISTDVMEDAKLAMERGRKLRALREQGALIFASGNVVHNLGKVDWSVKDGYDWADRFDLTIRDAILSGDYGALENYADLPDAAKAVPTAEHILPLFMALGATGPGDRVTVWNDYREIGSISMTSYLFEANE